MLPAELPALPLRAELLPLLVEGVPEIQQREEVRARVIKAPVRGAGGVLLFQRALAGILTLRPAAMMSNSRVARLALGLEQHPAQRGVNRQSRQITAQGGQAALLVQRAQFLQQAVAGAMAAGVGG